MRRSMLGLIAALALAVSWPGPAGAATGWAITPMPLPSGVAHGLPLGVSCAAAGNCIAAGASASAALAWHWDGTTWASTPTATPAGAKATGLLGVSCGSAAQCVAVGFRSNGTAGGLLTLAESWNGATWSVQPTANPAGKIDPALAAVSCGSVTSCTAVGGSYGNNDGQALAEHWDGSAWTIQRTPALTARFSRFFGVSCPSASRCVAVGLAEHFPLAESWNGGTWVHRSVPVPATTSFASLSGVSCPAAESCIAVGYYRTSIGQTVPLAEHWNGSTWTLLDVPVSGNPGRAALNGVWCVTVANCTAVGYDQALSGSQALAEVWNGTDWAPQGTARPVAHKAFLSVSCPAVRTCSAVGDDTADGGSGTKLALPLAEHE